MTVEYLLDDFYDASADRRAGTPGDPASVHGDSTADYAPALARIQADVLASVALGQPLRPARVYITGRAAYHIYDTWRVMHPFELVGIGVPHRSGNSRIVAHECTAIHVTRSADGTRVGGLNARGFSLEYAGNHKSGALHHGILAHRPVTASDFFIYRFPGHGLFVEGNAANPGTEYANANHSSFSHGDIFSCGRSGVHVWGGDANVVTLLGLSAVYSGELGDDTDGYGFRLRSKLGGISIGLHARNNLARNYSVESCGGNAPSGDLLLNCYSEHSPQRYDQYRQPGPDYLHTGALAISNIRAGGGLEDHEGGGAHQSTGAQGQMRLGHTVELGGRSGASAIFGDSNPAASATAARLIGLLQSTAYGPTDLARLYQVHDPVRHEWAQRPSTPGGLAAMAITDHRHARPGLLVATRGLLVGSAAGIAAGQPGGPAGPRLLAYLDPRQESTIEARFAGALPGDVVLNELPTLAPGRDFLGWIRVIDAPNAAAPYAGPHRWVRFGSIATPAPSAPPTTP